MSVITQNASKRKNEELKCTAEEKSIADKVLQISKLTDDLEIIKKQLNEKVLERDNHSKFNEFLESVVNDKSNGDNKEFVDIEQLQNRFANLKSENTKLMNRVSISKQLLLEIPCT